MLYDIIISIKTTCYDEGAGVAIIHKTREQ